MNKQEIEISTEFMLACKLGRQPSDESLEGAEQVLLGLSEGTQKSRALAKSIAKHYEQLTAWNAGRQYDAYNSRTKRPCNNEYFYAALNDVDPTTFKDQQARYCIRALRKRIKPFIEFAAKLKEIGQ